MDYDRIGSMISAASKENAAKLANSIQGMEVAFYDRELRRVILGAVK